MGPHYPCMQQLSKKDIALKLHRQFAHAPSHKLLALMADAGHPWAIDHELKDEIKALSASCCTCHLYQKAKPKAAVALPTASNFQEVVAMDLKFFDGKILLHMIDHATRLSACTRIPSKRPEAIIKAFFSHWISVYGSPNKFLSDNGGEFINEEFT